MNSEIAARKVQKVSARIGDTLAFALSSDSRSACTQKLTSTSSEISDLVKWLAENQKKQFVPVRRALNIVVNSFSGIAEGLESKELHRREMRAMLKNVQNKFYPNVEQSLAEEVERLNERSESKIDLSEKQQAVKKTLSISNTDWKSALNVVRETLRNIEEKVAADKKSKDQAHLTDDEHLMQQIQQLEKFRKNLPVNMSNAYQVVRLPIVPIFEDFRLNQNATFWSKLGIRTLPVEGYSILQDQLLLLVSRKSAEKYGTTSKEFAESALEVLNEKGGVNYALVSDRSTASPRNADHIMFWIMPASKVTAIIKAVGFGTAKVNWGLPFS
jgi:hypothetical protein